MKQCPTCNRTYTDDAMSFCLEDGGLLISVGAPSTGGPGAGYDPNATLAYTPARDTSSTPAPVFPTNQPPRQVTPMQPMQPPPQWGPLPQAPPTGKKSSPLPWILGIVGVLLVLGIGAIVMLSIAGSNSNNSNNANNNNRAANNSNNANRAANANNANNANNSNNSNDTSTSANTLTDDFSTQKWGTGARAFGSYYADGEYLMKHSVADQYVVIYSPDEEGYRTEDATVKVTVRSVEGSNIPDVGYGLVVHGDLVNNKLQGYGFVIKNGPDPQFAVVMMKDGDQTTVVKPSKSSAIRSGTTPNQLEVRIKGTQMTFYINGQYATSVTDTEGFAGTDGRVGFYTSTGGEVAFDDLSIQK